MSDLTITMDDGTTLTFVQASTLARLIEENKGDDKIHWHPNDCGCCITMHGSDFAYVISADGEATFFADRGCSCA
jgi:hypothetical protein